MIISREQYRLKRASSGQNRRTDCETRSVVSSRPSGVQQRKPDNQMSSLQRLCGAVVGMSGDVHAAVK